MRGYKIPLLRAPVQEKIPLNTPLKEYQKFLVEKESKQGAIEKVSKHKDQHAQNQFLSNLIFCKEKRWGLPSGYKSENSKSVCTLYALQNRKFADFQIYDEGKKLHVQNRFEGRLFYSTFRQCRHLVRFLWERNLYEFLYLCFGLKATPRVFTKFSQYFPKILNIPFAQSKYQNFDLPGRHVVNVSINRKTSSRKRHRNLSPSTFGICNKLKKIGHGTGTNNQIFRSCDRLGPNDFFLTEEKVKGILQECKIIISMKEITVL